ncbi:MAG TPA: class I SAM-dependent methyltransferase [Solirubrobacteraceae bacterium]|nr:class I SAM-dependent methyltransferase [Solirubrobacteraceae bacterium]
MHGAYSGRDYHLARCPVCGYAFIEDPWLDYAEIYDERYYEGRGADPLVDYGFELDHPDRTIRRYEWSGIARVVRDLVGGLGPSTRWLDYGAGNGGLVRYLRDHRLADAVGFDEGSMAARARELGIPMLLADELDAYAGTFDVVTAIEVLEHTSDPLLELRRIRALLRHGGVLFLTTGNAEPYASKLTRWRYVLPEIHISFFEPRTLERALEASGFRAERRDLGPGFTEILKFKVLKTLRVRRRTALTDALPAPLLAAPAERLTRLSAHPVGWAD